MKQKVLITGGFGLLGCSLDKIVKTFSVFLDDYDFFFMSRTDCDLRDYSQTYEIFQLHKPSIVIHLASCVGGVYANIDKNYSYLTDNLKINSNIVEACRHFHVVKLINILSTCIFPDNGVTYPLSSDQLHNGLPHTSNIGYAYSKRLLHVSSELLSQTYGTVVVNLIPTNLYGENDNYNLDASHVIPALIHKTYLSNVSGVPLEVKGTGNAIRQFLYVDDLSRVIVHFMKENFDKHTNLSCIVSPPSNVEISIKQLVHNITAIFDFKGEVSYDTHASDGQLRKTTDDSELKRYIPGFTFTPMFQGLETTISYFKNNYDSIRK
jgi:GDP-L-fucose synthase